ncbi:MAG TPA: lipoprotein-releasing ABC transporter permease subunit [Steroidobacteraceae bacterium]|nr:lipoprotein-releasing ABC transporter permease subunit [Steroidobacteraceae bacterium]HQW10399.1 lipoprotein-releasing ABC transporter permease subunit [Steroidobacteraceae bacterium]HQX77727.1 lipoprotein-releasing ABC transporter permease subunit [Steroidobacteraceae bacterium]HQZ79644.1 lipoprotein-releasing ABC transporter permease subunit [Steroidobacteraceae bacterium]
MTRCYEWWIGTRYLASTHRRGFVSIVALISVMGLMLGVTVLIVVLSVMNGFERELRTRILAVTAHATLTGLEGTLDDWRGARGVALRTPGVRAAVPYIESQSMLVRGEAIAGAQVRGVEPAEERKADSLADRMREGTLASLTPGSWRVVLGDALAEELGATVGDSVVLIAPEGAATPTGVMPRMRRFTVSGIFSSGMYEYDRGLALVNLKDAARLFRTGDRVTGLRLELDEPYAAPRIVREVALALGGGFYVSDWTRNHANFFRSIEITKSLMFVILLMIVGVAAFNIVATLVMIVKDKQPDIAILRTLGAGPRNVLGAFVIQGVLIGLAGTTLGAGLGILTSRHLEALVRLLERALGTQFLDARVYYMSDLPAFVEWQDVVRVCGVAFVLCAIATLYPAWRAARTAPAEALRHE